MTHVAPAIIVDSIVTRFGVSAVHSGVSFTVRQGSVVALIGASGCGKSTLLREIVGLLRPTSGTITLLDVPVWSADEETLQALRKRFGVLFQNSALFSALTVWENIAMPMKEQSSLPQDIIQNITRLRLDLVGLPENTGEKMPNELSGGMKKRVGLARALALEPEVLFLDEPTSGLDPINARLFDRLIRTLCDALGLTVVMVTHDLDTVLSIVDHLVVLESGRVLSEGPVSEVKELAHPWIETYFSSRS